MGVMLLTTATRLRGEVFESLLRRYKKVLKASGIERESRNRQYFEAHKARKRR
jgi:ribosomal protein S21